MSSYSVEAYLVGFLRRMKRRHEDLRPRRIFQVEWSYSIFIENFGKLMMVLPRKSLPASVGQNDFVQAFILPFCSPCRVFRRPVERATVRNEPMCWLLLLSVAGSRQLRALLWQFAALFAANFARHHALWGEGMVLRYSP